LVERVRQNLQVSEGMFKQFKITIRNFGAFPGKRSPRVFWLGVDSEPRESLFDLFVFIEDNLHSLGFEKEKRRFSPHLTLARVKKPERFDALWNFAEKHPFEPYSFEVKEFVLMQSFLKPDGAVYKPIQKYSL